MALSLNTGHPLYNNLIALVCVDDDNSIVDLVTPSRTLTPDVGVSIGSGTYGRHFATTTGSDKGVSLTALGDTTAAYPSSTRFVVLNSITGSTGRASFHNQGSTNPTILLSSTGKAGSGLGASTQAHTPVAQGTTTILNTGAHSVALTTTGTTSHDIYVDGAHEATGGRLVYSTSTSLTHIGGYTTYGSVAAEFAWYVVFDKTLSPAEIAELHSSLGADNAFSLVAGGGTTVNATLGSVGVSAYTATIIAAQSVTVNATLASINVTPYAATIVNLASITTEPLKNNTGTVLASTGSIIATVYDLSTGALVVRKTGLTSDGSGVVTFSDAALVAATQYLVTITIATADGVARLTAE